MRLRQFRFQPTLLAVFMLFLGESARFNASVHQGKQPQPRCPVLKLTCPDTVNVGASLVFALQVSGGDPNVTPTFNWSVSNGSLSSGQGTATVELDTTGLSDGDTVTATVEAGGFDRECRTYASCTSSLVKKPEARKFDEYSALTLKDEEARLDTFAIELQNDPPAQGYIIGYIGATSRPQQKAEARAKGYLVNKRGIDASRLVTVAGGSREQATVELWIVPSSAEPPKATPSADPSKPKPASPAKPKKP
ncbi:MAG: hypothetical protein AABO41_18670 [Acidobacteriota bacterium]